MDSDLARARAAYENAIAEAQKYGNEAMEALQKSDLVSSEESRALFRKKAKRAIVAYENWRKSAELALSVIAEIEGRA